ncbi:MAG: cytochrome c3 family protein [Thermoanaerobaculia bacterium]
MNVRPRERVLFAAALAVSFVLAGAGTTALTLGGGPEFFRPTVSQPIAFNHQKHTKDLDLACPTCHLTVEKEAFSSLPDAEVCASCHSEPQGKSEEEKKLVQLLKAGTPLSWEPLFRQPSHIFYSHRRHVAVAKIDCSVCHGAIAASTVPPGRVRRLRMNDCISCHRRTGASTDCTTCHR